MPAILAYSGIVLRAAELGNERRGRGMCYTRESEQKPLRQQTKKGNRQQMLHIDTSDRDKKSSLVGSA